MADLHVNTEKILGVKFTSIRNHFCANRHEVLGNYVRFLQNQVNVGYIATEETNTELAGQFK